MYIKGISAGMLAAGIVFLGSACTSTEEMGSSGTFEQAQSAASAAQSAAERALSAAQQAQSMAAEADRKASEALRAANDANNCCRQNSEKIDRAFERSMQK